MGMTPRYDVARLLDDMGARGWIARDLARAADLSDQTISRFLRGERQCPRTAGAIARALGFSLKRYLIRSSEQGVAV